MIAIYGSGDTGRHVLDIVLRRNSERDVVFLDDDESMHGATIRGYPVVGTVDALDQGVKRDCVAVPAYGAGQGIRLRMGERLENKGVSITSVVDSSAVISDTASIGDGTVVSPQSFFGPAVRIDDFVFMHGSVNISHDTHINRGVTIGPGVTVAGGVEVGRDAYLGVGATISDHVTVGAGAMVGAGAVVVDDVPESETVAGVPARRTS